MKMNSKPKKNLFKWITFILVCIFSFGLIALNLDIHIGYGADVTGLSISGLSASYDNGTWDASGNTITGEVKTKESSSCTGTTYTQTISNLTLKNTSSEDKILTVFISKPNGDGEVNPLGDQTWTIAPNGSQVITVSSKKSGSDTTIASITIVSYVGPQNVNITFKAPVNGSYMVDGESITSDTVKTKLNTESFSLVAIAASGYKFFGWYDETNSTYLSKTASDDVIISNSIIISPHFILLTIPVFQVGTDFYTDLNDAVSYAVSSGNDKIVLVSNGTLSSGSYTIPNGKTLLIPFDDAHITYTTVPGLIYGQHTTPSAFKTLTMDDGANIIIASGGRLSCSGKLSGSGTGSGSWNGTPTGPHGRISMSTQSKITVQSGGSLYVYGYISGSGIVEVRSGGTVYEAMQFRCWRGGTATSGMTSGVFPMNQYYVQNVEANLKIYAGSKEYVYTAVNASSSAYGASAEFIGSSGMFRISSGYINKKYDGTTDRLIIDIYGNTSLADLSLSIKGLPLIGTINLNTNNYDSMPINSNITINIMEGTTDVNINLSLLPGTVLNVEYGATVNIASGKNIYVYDKDQWGNYAAAGAQLVVVGYSTVNGTTTKRTQASLIDSMVNINGIINVSGGFYTTESGANITSSNGTGHFKQLVAVETSTSTTTQQATQNNTTITKVSIPITAAKLHNGNETYTLTSGSSSGTDFYYCNVCDSHGIWEKEHSATTYTITWKNDDGTTLATSEVSSGEIPSYPGSTPSKNPTAQYTYTFSGWTPEIVPATADATYTAQFSNDIRSYLITWVDGNGDELLSEQYNYGATPSYSGVTPTKESTAQYDYTFNNTWSPAITNVTGPATYTAQFDQTIREYTITWVDGDGNTLLIEQYNYGATPVYSGPTPTKSSDDEHSYTFDNSWSPEITAVTGDATYTAQFSTQNNKYQISWYDGDNQLLYSELVAEGETPSYAGDTPTKTSDAQYDYTFNGQWSPTIAPVTSSASYTAQFNGILRKYTITFENEDGTTLQSGLVEYGTVPTYDGATPTKEGNAQYTYTFAGWSPNITSVTGDVIYVAIYSATVNEYEITWEDGSGNIFKVDTVVYGNIPNYDGPTPTKPSDAQYSYEFIGWSPSISAVTKNETYVAQFEAVPIQYSLTLIYDLDSSKTKVISLNYGDTYELTDFVPEFGMPADYHIKYWSENSTRHEIGESITITGNIILTAYTGGWVTRGATEHYFIPYESVIDTTAKGLYYCEQRFSTEKKVHYFDEVDGKWRLDYTGTYSQDGTTYYVKDGFVDSSQGLKQVNKGDEENPDYYYCYVNSNGEVITSNSSTNIYFDNGQTSTYLCEGYYLIDSDGYFVRQDNNPSKDGEIYIKDGYAYIDGIRVAYGLFVYNGNYYYATEDGSLAKNGSYYVVRLNGYDVSIDIYYFDSEGRMCNAQKNVISVGGGN